MGEDPHGIRILYPPGLRHQTFDLFSTLIEASGASAIKAQTSDHSLATILHWACHEVRTEKIVFRDGVATSLPSHDVKFINIQPEQKPRIFTHHHEPVGEHGLVIGDQIVATGGIAWHYNRPYADIFMEVDTRFQRQGYGGYLVQELKRLCHENDGIPCARCDITNIASFRTIQKAGMIACAHLLTGSISRARVYFKYSSKRN